MSDVSPDASSARCEALREPRRSADCKREAHRVAGRHDAPDRLAWVGLIDHMLEPATDSSRVRLELAHAALADLGAEREGETARTALLDHASQAHALARALGMTHLVRRVELHLGARD